MVANNGSPAEDPKDQGLKGVVDELKNLLSNLGNESSQKDEDLSPKDVKLPNTPPAEVDESALEEHVEKIPPFASVDEDKIAEHSSENTSDKDFWSGNVLGWPGKEKIKSENSPGPEPIPPGLVEPDPPDEPSPEEWLKSQSKETADKLNQLKEELELPDEVEPPPAEQPPAEQPPAEQPRAEQPLPEPPPAEPPPLEPAPTEPLPVEDLQSVEPVQAASPSLDLPPLDAPDLAIPEPPVNDPLFDTEFIPGTPPGLENVDQDETIVMPPAPDALDENPPPGSVSPDSTQANIGTDLPPFPDSPFPIPGSVENKEPPSKPKSKTSGNSDNVFESKAASDKHEGLLQIAVFYPQGQEKSGQHFVSNLKKACARSPIEINIQAVLIQGWNPEQIDVKGWIKIAKMSGATMIYVMSTKKDRDQFRKLASIAEDQQMKGRMVVVEQVGLRALYADLLTELRRIK